MNKKKLNQLINEFSSLTKEEISQDSWTEAYQKLWIALGKTENKFELEKSVTNKNSWDLPIPYKLALLEVAKYFGCNSFEFWKDYYQYKATYMEPDDPQRPFYLKIANSKYL